jgi:hypothetical protein
MSNANITDFIDKEYIDYLDTIPNDYLKQIELSIYYQLMRKDSHEIFEYIFKRLPIDENYYISKVLTGGQNNITVSALKFFDSKFNLSTFFKNDTQFSNFLIRYNLEISKYLYETHRKDKVIKPIPNSLLKYSIDRFSEPYVFLWIQTLKLTLSKALEKFSIKDKFSFVKKILQKKIWYEPKFILTVNKFKEYLAEINMDLNDFIKIMITSENNLTLINIFSKGDNDFIVWLIDKIGIDNKDVFNYEKFNKILYEIININVRKKTLDIEKINLLFGLAQILNIKFDVKYLEKEFKHIINCNYLSLDPDVNIELIYELIKLGVCPGKKSIFYNYYKEITIMN